MLRQLRNLVGELLLSLALKITTEEKAMCFAIKTYFKNAFKGKVL